MVWTVPYSVSFFIYFSLETVSSWNKIWPVRSCSLCWERGIHVCRCLPMLVESRGQPGAVSFSETWGLPSGLSGQPMTPSVSTSPAVVLEVRAAVSGFLQGTGYQTQVIMLGWQTLYQLRYHPSVSPIKILSIFSNIFYYVSVKPYSSLWVFSQPEAIP